MGWSLFQIHGLCKKIFFVPFPSFFYCRFFLVNFRGNIDDFLWINVRLYKKFNIFFCTECWRMRNPCPEVSLTTTTPCFSAQSLPGRAASLPFWHVRHILRRVAGGRPENGGLPAALASVPPAAMWGNGSRLRHVLQRLRDTDGGSDEHRGAAGAVHKCWLLIERVKRERNEWVFFWENGKD